ncbi:hypothetical protein SAMN05421636_1065 [Pricia antarctica]|uniref:Uncharacterized protein n=1 Tax=Pricia antarctica TaxID=641691 RepID=A0A1G7E429_9FLAO|nr:hypothetical protein [Pricia antarctica]SDE58115.1 hypothetical protein SAMN05421636_1065 [Pricia antarctica]
MAIRFIFLILTGFLMLSVSCSEENEAYYFQVNNDVTTLVGQPISIDLKQLKDAGINLKSPLQLNQEIDGNEARLDYQIDSVNGTFSFVPTYEGNTEGDTWYRIENLTKPRKLGVHVFEW